MKSTLSRKRRFPGAMSAAVRAAIVAVVAGIASAAALGQPATLVRDINPGTGPKTASFGFQTPVRSGSLVYFDSEAGGGGIELWRTDGTTAGTAMVADIGVDDGYHPGGDPSLLTDVNGTLFFVSTSSPGGLWKTDGSPAGTVLVDPSGQFLAVHAVAGTLFYFKYVSGTGSMELWKTDGTPGGTGIVKGGFAFTFSSNMYLPAAADANGLLFFNADDGVSGVELWKSDGTPGGTALVRDINPGSAPSNPAVLTAVGTSVFFRACEPAAGCELWKSDGTSGGTVLVKDIVPGPADSAIGALVASGGRLVFVASDFVTGFEIWTSDGTDTGTVLLRDIRPGSASSFPNELTAGPGGVYFSADDGTTGRELWKTDGTPAGTIRLADLNVGPLASNPGGFSILGSNVYFHAFDSQRGNELWKTDGTPGGTGAVFDVSVRSPFAELSGFLVFFGTNASPYSADLWKTDGTPAGTSRFFTFDAPAGSSPTFMTASGTDVVFTATTPSDGPQVFRSDGTSAGTIQLTSIEHSYWNPSYEFKTVAGKTYFTSDGYLWVTPGETGAVEQLTSGGAVGLGSLGGTLLFFLNGPTPGLWKSDGTLAGTQFLHAFPYGLTVPVEAGGVAYVISGSELWKTDGTPGGTVFVKTLTGNSPVYGLTAFNGLLFFVMGDSTNAAIWRSDGTDAGTHPEIPLAAGNLTVAGNTLYFTAVHPASGNELWKTDGTLNGTFLVQDIRPGANSSDPQYLVANGSELFFAAIDDAHGMELWKSDGTDPGTVRLTDIRAGSGGSDIQGLTVSGGLVYFTASDISTGVELWKSDGTPGGTSVVKDIYPGPASANPGSLADVGGVLYFAATDPIAGRELWKSDGTPGGTTLVRDIDPSLNDAFPSGGVEVGGLLYFAANTEANGVELWRSDGTTGGTAMVRDLIPGPYSGSPSSIASVGGRVFFAGFDEVLGLELWASDGTAAGTALVKDIQPGTGSSQPQGLTAFAGRIYFSADDGVHGQELWVSDGTNSGTYLLADLTPGLPPSYPNGFRAIGPYLYFEASNPPALWRTDGTAAGTIQLSATVYPPTAVLRGNVYFLRSPGTGTNEIWETDGTVGGTQLIMSLPINAYELVRSGGFLYFWGFGAGDLEVWRSDGTAAGTAMLKSGFVEDYSPQFTDVGGTLFFVADDRIHGRELWKSNGTPAGTVLVSDIWPGSLSSQPAALIDVGGTLVFRANDGVHGSELWASDGTGPGTHLLQDIQAGAASSRPGFTPSSDWSAIAGTRVYFPATDSVTGNELWSMPMSAVCTPPAAPTIQSSKNPSCGDAVVLDAGPGYASYLWSTGETTRTIQVMPAVTTAFTVYAGNARGCRASQTIVQAVDPSMVPAAPAASNSGPACVGDTIQLNASTVAGASYRWTGPNGFTSTVQNPTIPSASLAVAGQYSVEATVNGCTSAPATTTVSVHAVPFRPLAHNDGPHCAGQTLQLSASYVPNAVYSWTGPNGFTSSLQSPVILSATPAASGIYSVTVNVDGCVSLPASTSVVVAACQALPVALSADAGGNGILEPGEMIALAPSWMNATGSPLSMTGTATSFTGPAGATYSLSDATADYGTVAPGATSSCIATADCYAVGVSASATRPILHWDAAFSEALSTGDSKTWSLHVGDSFSDVPPSAGFYRFVEILLHNGVTTGCGSGAYCPSASVSRAQMAVFLLVSEAGAGYVPPSATGTFADVPVASPFAPWIEELARRGVTAGCGNGNFCPQADVTRAQMAVFLLVTREGATYVPPHAVGVFGDVPYTSPFAPWIEELYHRGIAAGCGNGNYCPASPVSRAQMAVLLTTTFGLSLGTP